MQSSFFTVVPLPLALAIATALRTVVARMGSFIVLLGSR
jgi:hypothetical protein